MMPGTKVTSFMNKSEIKNSADLFLYKAIIDLNSAKYLLDAYNNDIIEIDMEKIYFELQQCAEKLFKSLLSERQVSVPKIHDIEQIIYLCRENDIDLEAEVETLGELSDYAVEGRYSILHDDINRSDRFIKILETLIKKIQHDRDESN